MPPVDRQLIRDTDVMLRMDADVMLRLLEVGILGKIELSDGVLIMAGIPMALSEEQRAAAAELGIYVPAEGPPVPGWRPYMSSD